MSEFAYLSIGVFGTPIEYYEASDPYDLGKHTIVKSETMSLFGVIQPASPAGVQALPSGQQADVRYTLHTQRKLNVSYQDQSSTDTYVIHKGVPYKVVDFSDWDNQKFYKYGLIRTEEAR